MFPSAVPLDERAPASARGARRPSRVFTVIVGTSALAIVIVALTIVTTSAMPHRIANATTGPSPTSRSAPASTTTTTVLNEAPPALPTTTTSTPVTALEQERALLPAMPPPVATELECAGGYTSRELNELIHEARGGTGVVGADYARVQVLPDGKVLWTLQDVFVGRRGESLGEAEFVHNAGLIQNGSCFRLLRGERGGSWIGEEKEVPMSHWFWALDSIVDTKGQLAEFVVEMHNPNGTGAAEGAEPVAVWIATISLEAFTVTDLRPAPDSGDRPLYGFSITSDDHYHYLYGNCYRQYVDPGYLGLHDTTCGPLVYLARIPLGHPEVVPEYWTGSAWSPRRDAARPITNRGSLANPMQVRRMGGAYVGVTKVDDWWGDSVVIDVARSPEGPFVTITTAKVAPACDRCNTYFAQLLPWTDANGSLLITISNNAWNMKRDAFPHPERYRPSVLAIALPASVPEVGGPKSSPTTVGQGTPAGYVITTTPGTPGAAIRIGLTVEATDTGAGTVTSSMTSDTVPGTTVVSTSIQVRRR